MRTLRYSDPATLNDALAALGPDARPLAGGTDLLPLMKDEVVAPEHLICVRKVLPRGVVSEGGHVSIGAATALAEIERDPLLLSAFAAVPQAAAGAASLQLRNMATVGGNLLQRPRCWYFRNPHLHCWLKGGERCLARDGENRRHALFGGSRCVAVHASDLAPALLAVDAEVQLRRGREERVMSLEAFFALPDDEHRTETRLGTEDLLLAVRLPCSPSGARSVYVKVMDRAAFSFALASVAAALALSPERRIRHVRVVLGGVAPIPWRAHAAERVLAGAEPTERALSEAAEAAVEDAAPLAGNAWKIRLVRTLVVRALRTLAAQG